MPPPPLQRRQLMNMSTVRQLLLLATFLAASMVIHVHIKLLNSPKFKSPADSFLPIDRAASIQLTQSQDKLQTPLIFGAGFGTTATHAMFKATCQLRLRSLHYEKQCGFWKYRRFNSTDPELPSPGVLAHERLLRAHRALKDCIASGVSGTSCPTVREAMDGMRRHIDLVLSNAKDIDVLHDTPYPEFAEYVMEAAQRFQGVKPILLLSERDPQNWAQKRVSHDDDLVCRLQSDKYSRDASRKYLGENIYWCLQAAIEKNLDNSPINEVFWNVHQLESQPDKRAEMLEQGYLLYRDVMRSNNAVFQTDLFEHNNRTSNDLLAIEIKSALKKQMAVVAKSKGSIRNVVRRTPDFNTQKGCMLDYRAAFSSGRFCNKLVILLHFHKAGGSSIIEHFIDRGLWYDLNTNIDVANYGTFEEGKDVSFGGYGRNHLKIHSSVNETRVSRPDFWESIYKRGIDVVNLEFNFLPPYIFHKVQASFWKVTQLREPWERYRATYERELHLKCGDNYRPECIESKANSLRAWMINPKGAIKSKRQEKSMCILCSNYYTRMLNGMGDYPREALVTREHLEAAKSVLDTFDVVMILEDSDDTNLNKLMGLFGTANEEVPPLPKESNNKVKEDVPMYQFLREQVIDPMEEFFRIQNKLDIELYEYARKRFAT